MFKPESLTTQSTVPVQGQVGTAVWQNGLQIPRDFLAESSKGNTQHALCLDNSFRDRKYDKFRDNKKTFSPTTNVAFNWSQSQPPPPPLQYTPAQLMMRRSRHQSQRRPRPPSYHRVTAGQRRVEIPSNEAYYDRKSKIFSRYPRKERLADEALYYSYYSDEDSAKYYYIDQALPYEQWKQLLLRQGSLCEISSSSLALATEWLV